MTATDSDQCMIEENRQDHPAVAAWLELDPANQTPDSVFVLFDANSKRKKHKTKKKSAVYRLVGANLIDSDVVAKRCSRATAHLERAIYEDILPQLPTSSLKFYGSVEADGVYWLFLEYARGKEWRMKNETHLELAIQWLARMHTCSSQLDSIVQLPDRGPSYYLSQLEKARKAITENYLHPGLHPKDIDVLNLFFEHTELIDHHWQEIQSFCDAMPVALVHNDFAGKNVHVRDTSEGPVLLPFDWEMSGKGAPAVDLHWMFLKAPSTTVARYYAQISNSNSAISLSDIEHLAILGAIFRTLDAIQWSSQSFFTSYPQRQIAYIESYTNRLKTAYAALGWS